MKEAIAPMLGWCSSELAQASWGHKAVGCMPTILDHQAGTPRHSLAFACGVCADKPAERRLTDSSVP